MASRPPPDTDSHDGDGSWPFWLRRGFYLVMQWFGAVLGVWWFGALCYAGLPVMFEMLVIGALAILIVLPPVRLKREPDSRTSRPARDDIPGLLFLLMFFLPIALIFLSAPCRALILWFAEPLPQRPAGWSMDVLYLRGTELPFGLDVMFKQMIGVDFGLYSVAPLHAFHFDLLAGGVATVVGLMLWWTVGGWQLRMARQLRNIPTATARAAAVGLAEFRGVARGTDPILLLRTDGTQKVDHVVAPFVLEDATGRIRVDPGDAVIRSYWSSQFLQRAGAQIVLTRHVQARTFGRPEVRELRDGDPVYVLGNVEPDGEGIDSGRLLVRRKRHEVPLPWLYRFLRAKRLPERFADIDVFFVTDTPEKSAHAWIMADFRKTSIIGLALVGPSAWLFWHGGRGLGWW